MGNLCTHCNYPLTSEEHFYQHFDQHVISPAISPSIVPGQAGSPNGGPSSSHTTPLGSNQGDKKHVECIVCKQPLTSAAELQTHAKFHSHIDVTARGYRCSVCYQTFQTKTNLHCKVSSTRHPKKKII